MRIKSAAEKERNRLSGAIRRANFIAKGLNSRGEAYRPPGPQPAKQLETIRQLGLETIRWAGMRPDLAHFAESLPLTWWAGWDSKPVQAMVEAVEEACKSGNR